MNHHKVRRNKSLRQSFLDIGYDLLQLEQRGRTQIFAVINKGDSNTFNRALYAHFIGTFRETDAFYHGLKLAGRAPESDQKPPFMIRYDQVLAEQPWD